MSLFLATLYLAGVAIAASLIAWDRYHFGPYEKKEKDREPESITEKHDP